MLRVKAKLVEKNKAGYARFVSELGGLSAISLGVQGAEASKTYPDRPGVTVGDVARWHELGEVPGAPARAWLTAARASDGSVESLSTTPSLSTPQWPWSVYSHRQVSTTTTSSGAVALTALVAR